MRLIVGAWKGRKLCSRKCSNHLHSNQYRNNNRTTFRLGNGSNKVTPHIHKPNIHHREEGISKNRRKKVAYHFNYLKQNI